MYEMNLAENYGKEFEQKLSSLLITQSNEHIIYRIPDQMSGRKGSKNPCDFIFYSYPNIFWLECKSTVNPGWSISELDKFQLESMREYSKTKGSFSYVLLLFVCEPSVFAIPISTIDYLIENGIGTININKLRKGKYERDFIEVPLAKNRSYIPDFAPEALDVLLKLPNVSP